MNTIQNYVILWGLLSAALSSGCRMGGMGAGEAGGINFREVRVADEGGLSDRRDVNVVSGRFLSDGLEKNPGLIRRGKDGRGMLEIYRISDAGEEEGVKKIELPSSIGFVATAGSDKRDRVVIYNRESRKLEWIDLENGDVRELMDLALPFSGNEDGRFPRVDAFRDVNGDGYEDLFYPTPDGFWLAYQLADWQFSEPVQLGPPEPYRKENVHGMDVGLGRFEKETTLEEVGITPMTFQWYMSRVFHADIDRDGIKDLIFWHDDHLEVFPQSKNPELDPDVIRKNKVRYPVMGEIDGAGSYGRAFEYRDDKPMDVILGLNPITSRRHLHGLDDINGDGRVDFIVMSMSGKSMINQKSRFDILLGSEEAMEKWPSLSIDINGRAGGLRPWGYSSEWIMDFNNDGQKDILIQRVKINTTGIIRALAGNSIALDLDLYLMEDGKYSDRPSGTFSIRPDLILSSAKGPYFPASGVGDFDGDGYLDLMVGHNFESFQIFTGSGDGSGFSSSPQEFEYEMPANEKDVLIEDLNGDGKDDLMILRRHEKSSGSFSVLIAQ